MTELHRVCYFPGMTLIAHFPPDFEPTETVEVLEDRGLAHEGPWRFPGTNITFPTEVVKSFMPGEMDME